MEKTSKNQKIPKRLRLRSSLKQTKNALIGHLNETDIKMMNYEKYNGKNGRVIESVSTEIDPTQKGEKAFKTRIVGNDKDGKGRPSNYTVHGRNSFHGKH